MEITETTDIFKKPQNYRAWLPFWAFLRREIFRFKAVWMQSVLAPVVSVSLYLLVFGVSLGQRISVLDGFSYVQYVVPALIFMGVINNSFANSSSSLFMMKYLGYIVEFLVIPLKPYQMTLAFTIASMARGFLVGSIILIVSMFFTSMPWVDPLVALSFVALASLIFSQFGLIAAIYSKTFDTISMYTNFLILPLVYLGGTFYPVSQLPSPWNKVSSFNPLYYFIEGFRKAILGVGDVPYWQTYALAIGLSFILVIWTSSLFAKGHNMRS